MTGYGKSSGLAIDSLGTISCTRNKTSSEILRLEDPKQSHVEHNCGYERSSQFYADCISQYASHHFVMGQRTIEFLQGNLLLDSDLERGFPVGDKPRQNRVHSEL